MEMKLTKKGSNHKLSSLIKLLLNVPIIVNEKKNKSKNKKLQMNDKVILQTEKPAN